MYHSVYFIAGENLSLTGAFNSYTTYNMIPDGRPVIATPTPVTNYIEVPGAIGQLDMSEALTGYPLYGNREGSLSFIVLNNYQGSDSWNKRYQHLCWHLHGKRLKMILEDDPEYYYEGRFTVDSWETPNSNDFSKVEIGYNLDPYKYDVDAKVVAFTISNDTRSIQYSYADLGSMPVIPTIKVSNVSNRVTVRCINDDLNLDVDHEMNTSGTYRFADIILSDTRNSNPNCRLQFSGTGSVEITTRGGDL